MACSNHAAKRKVDQRLLAVEFSGGERGTIKGNTYQQQRACILMIMSEGALWVWPESAVVSVKRLKKG